MSRRNLGFEIYILLSTIFTSFHWKDCEIEHVCCGAGLSRIYNFLCVELKANKSMLDPAEVNSSVEYLNNGLIIIFSQR